MKRYIIEEPKKDLSTPTKTEETSEDTLNEDSKETLVDAESSYYKIGDSIDVRLLDTGAWYEGRIEKILKKQEDGEIEEKKLIFRIKR